MYRCGTRIIAGGQRKKERDGERVCEIERDKGGRREGRGKGDREEGSKGARE